MTDASTFPFPEVFDGLKGLLQPFGDQLVATADEPGHYALDTRHVVARKRALFFGGVQAKKRYVSYHLMPVYLFPDLLEGLPDALERRMHGKSCFNVTALDREVLAALGELTRRGFERYEQEGLL